MYELPARGPTQSETGPRVAKTSRCALAFIQTYLRFRLPSMAFLVFHYYLEHPNVEADPSTAADKGNPVR